MNEGAAVRVSLVSFGKGESCFLNGQPVEQITAELGGSAACDMSIARALAENAGTSFEGTKKYGDFDIAGELARSWLRQPNPHGRPNSDVVKPWRNGQGLAKRPTDIWIIDFGSQTSEVEAVMYEAPFKHVLSFVKPERTKVGLHENWWLHERARGAMRIAMASLARYVATVRMSKHRYFCFLNFTILPDTRLNVFARADDTSFGLLSSRMHEVWSLAQASMHGVGNDPTYNAKSCFETFPFPPGLSPADTAHQRTAQVGGSPHPRPLPGGEGVRRERGVAGGGGAVGGSPYPSPLPGGEGVRKGAEAHAEAGDAAVIPAGLAGDVRAAATNIALAAKRLNDLRGNWLNPPEWTQRLPEVIPLGMDTSPYPDRIVPKNGYEKELAERTLTKLYNQRPAWLDAAHKTLDVAVAAAYGWADYRVDMADEEILMRLLALNLQRAA